MGIERALRVIVVDPTGKAGAALQTFFEERGLNVTELSTVRSTHKAVLEFGDESFDYCFIDATLSHDELVEFFGDLEKLKLQQGRAGCAVLLFTPEKAPSVPPALEASVFGGVSLKGTAGDYDTILAAEALWRGEEELQERRRTVQYATDKLLDVIDRAACDIRRRAHKALRSSFQQVIEHETRQSEELLDNYLETLTEKTEKREGHDGTNVVEIPDALLSKELPKLERDAYTGASQRVWEKVKRKFASSPNATTAEEGPSSDGANSPTPPTPTSPPEDV